MSWSFSYDGPADETAQVMLERGALALLDQSPEQADEALEQVTAALAAVPGLLEAIGAVGASGVNVSVSGHATRDHAGSESLNVSVRTATVTA